MVKDKIKSFNSLQEELINELETFQRIQKSKYPEKELLKIDLHCHDHNSDVPDELLGRILNVPETWLKTEKLIEMLEKSGSDVHTITNHNNARSCYKLQEQGKDILTGAEFTCTVNDFNTYIHVLTYGFNAEQEKVLNKLRKNVYDFQRYAFENNIPTIWAHPLYQYNPDFKVQSLDFFKKMTLIFERFEVLNGQRDTWQNMLIKVWLEKLTPEKIEEYAEQTGIDPKKYCRDPYKKHMSGGSDSHLGIFSGLTGTYLHVPDLENRLKTTKKAELALEAIREGRMSPYGSHNNSEKLTVAFLDYVFQIALNSKDPGLLRILLHKGSANDKILALIVSNGFAEMKRHKVTMKFIELFHNCFMGESPAFTKRFFVPTVYKPIFNDAVKIAATGKNNPENTLEIYKESIFSIHSKLNKILFERLNKKLEAGNWKLEAEKWNFDELIGRFELPSEIRAYTDKISQNSIPIISGQALKTQKENSPDINKFLDGLSFPFIASSLILAAHFTSAKVLYNVRPVLEKFSEELGCLKHPKRMLWLTDTFDDNNGVSMVLQSYHKEIKERNLPIDIMICSSTVEEDEHLIVMKPLAEFNLSFYKQQPLRIPDFLEIHRIFHEREYDRIICSTEGPMGLASIYLKNAYSVKAYFYLHTDWVMFAKKMLNVDDGNLSRVRRLLRSFYMNFDGLFVLNTDQLKWLSSKKMGFDNSRLNLTAHWVEEQFCKTNSTKKNEFGLEENDYVILYAGRVSNEKGVMELPEIYNKAKIKIKNLKIVIVGTGPSEKELKEKLTEGIFLGWVDHEKLPAIYSAADLLILPSKFDTFGNVVLEALSCGLPVIAYNTKGPKDIIEDGKNGYLAFDSNEMMLKVISYFSNSNMHNSFKEDALKRSLHYSKERIITTFLEDVELGSRK